MGIGIAPEKVALAKPEERYSLERIASSYDLVLLDIDNCID